MIIRVSASARAISAEGTSPMPESPLYGEAIGLKVPTTGHAATGFLAFIVKRPTW